MPPFASFANLFFWPFDHSFGGKRADATNLFPLFTKRAPTWWSEFVSARVATHTRKMSAAFAPRRQHSSQSAKSMDEDILGDYEDLEGYDEEDDRLHDALATKPAEPWVGGATGKQKSKSGSKKEKEAAKEQKAAAKAAKAAAKKPADADETAAATTDAVSTSPAGAANNGPPALARKSSLLKTAQAAVKEKTAKEQEEKDRQTQIELARRRNHEEESEESDDSEDDYELQKLRATGKPNLDIKLTELLKSQKMLNKDKKCDGNALLDDFYKHIDETQKGAEQEAAKIKVEAMRTILLKFNETFGTLGESPDIFMYSNMSKVFEQEFQSKHEIPKQIIENTRMINKIKQVIVEKTEEEAEARAAKKRKQIEGKEKRIMNASDDEDDTARGKRRDQRTSVAFSRQLRLK